MPESARDKAPRRTRDGEAVVSLDADVFVIVYCSSFRNFRRVFHERVFATAQEKVFFRGGFPFCHQIHIAMCWYAAKARLHAAVAAVAPLPNRYTLWRVYRQ